ncbi:MAG: hypothetical protein NTY41_11185 [Proteobacteria bacterium]|nr:hypothetical protein [Pseudomonadota bacterium]
MNINKVHFNSPRPNASDFIKCALGFILFAIVMWAMAGFPAF